MPLDFFLTISSMYTYESDDSLVQELEEDSSSLLNSDRSTSLESEMFSPAQLAGLEFSRFLMDKFVSHARRG